ncbi:MAG: 5-oxoprolinase [Beggiatoa sp. IS2]|nr:MAG: 5-oxoprolinase [Beggiatoa sp. IS2]
MATIPKKWQFWIDRGGTFTDIVAQHPEGYLLTHKLLSDNPKLYKDAAIQGIRDILGLKGDEPLLTTQIAAVKMGTTVATNALLERRGERTVLLITKGLGDVLRIGYQTRPELFNLNIVLPELLYERIIEVEEKYSVTGEELLPVRLDQVVEPLQQALQQGITAVAIVFLHGYRYHAHEDQVAELAKQLGFKQISVSHQVSPLQKLVSRGDTTVVDAYLSPILRRYVNEIADVLKDVKLLFMQSNGGLTDAWTFQGKDAILSGPAGGYVGAVKTATAAGFNKIINFDMGGTSTDVSHFCGEYEREFETQIAGVRLFTPIIKIHTIAAGGGSVCGFDGSRFRVGPQSAGAKPGPACYRQGGPLTITDCNVLLGRLSGKFFPNVFGESGHEPLDENIVKEKFTALANEISAITGKPHNAIEVAAGFLTIAVDNMAHAIKKVSIQRGYDVTEYTLVCFGGAGGQHACLVADSLGIETILIHPKAGVLSALGMGLADIRALREQAIMAELNDDLIPELETTLIDLEAKGRTELYQQGLSEYVLRVERKVHLRYSGTDSTLLVTFADGLSMKTAFTTTHQQRYGFVRSQTPLIVEAVSIEVIGSAGETAILQATHYESVPPSFSEGGEEDDSVLPQPLDNVPIVCAGKILTVPVYARELLPIGCRMTGPLIMIEKTSTTIVEPDWQVEVTPRYDLLLSRCKDKQTKPLRLSTIVDPVMLEIFNNLFMSIAEQMGATLANTAYSVNIKERLDFSCAVFDQQGQLIANAPHIPVHLGSMSDSVQAVIKTQASTMSLGDVFVLNNPYRGGTHLPDITVVTPVFDDKAKEILFYVASRGHHADIGGITPGSMPAYSRTLDEEGVIIDMFQLVREGQLQEAEMRKILLSATYPARNLDQNLADLRAQIAANATGIQELYKMVNHFGLELVQAYMQHVQDNAEAAVRRLLNVLKEGEFCSELDNGTVVRVKITIDKHQQFAIIDFSGTSPQQDNNYNAPMAVCKAAILYVFRTLVEDEIPLNAGCLKPLQIIIPKGCLLNPTYPAAVVAGNVEISQCVVNTLFGALGVVASSQGTMNNLTFGNRDYQYYETICGGAGAGPNFHGVSAIQTHMTNTRLTDPEVLEWRFPVRLEEFSIRKGSGGNGRYCGGDGVIRRIRFLEDMTVSILSEHRRIPPYGLAGGEPGQVGKNWIERTDGTQEILAGTATAKVNAGDILVIATPGGGGYGSCSSVANHSLDDF